MPPLLCLSPALLDQSFPKDDNELYRVLEALGEIQRYLEESRFGLIMTEYLRMIASEEFCYTRFTECEYLRDINRLIQQWVLQPNNGIENVNLDEIENVQNHPPPMNYLSRGLIELWQEEVGKLLYVHDTLCVHNEYFVGVACDSAFAGGELGEYSNPDNQRAFPLVGPETIITLSDAYEWDIPPEIGAKNVTLDNFYKNYRYIYATDISAPSGRGGSHCPVHFIGRRSWPLDINYNPILHDHLRTLSRTTVLPVNVLKDSLINGRFPKKVCKFHPYQD
jgi:hypothetical protein